MADEISVNRPIVIKRGWEGDLEDNQVTCYFGRWAVFKFPLTDGAFAELRMPIDEALDEGLVIQTDQIVFQPEDFEDDEEPEFGDDY